MPHLVNLARWEWFKLNRRWMPWVLLAILLLFSQLFIWGSFFNYRSMEARLDAGAGFGTTLPDGTSIEVTCEDILRGDLPDVPLGMLPEGGPSPDVVLEQFRRHCLQEEDRQREVLAQARGVFTLPGSLPISFNIAHSIGLLLMAILTASVIGGDYAWGTLRAVLVRGTGRWQYLAAKLGMLVLLAGAALAVVAAAVSLSSLLAGWLAGTGGTGGTATGWGEAVEMFLRSWFGMLPFVALAAAVTVLTNSSAAGIGISLAYNFVEQIAVAILINLFDWFEGVAAYLLGRNISAWMQGNGDTPAFNLGRIIGEVPGQWHALAVLAAYMAGLSALAFWLFIRRDIKGAGGA